jgi:hypothetical protein
MLQKKNPMPQFSVQKEKNSIPHKNRFGCANQLFGGCLRILLGNKKSTFASEIRFCETFSTPVEKHFSEGFRKSLPKRSKIVARGDFQRYRPSLKLGKGVSTRISAKHSL